MSNLQIGYLNNGFLLIEYSLYCSLQIWAFKVTEFVNFYVWRWIYNNVTFFFSSGRYPVLVLHAGTGRGSLHDAAPGKTLSNLQTLFKLLNLSVY